MVRFIYKKAPCKCLKALKRQLKEKYGPQFDTCKNTQCQKVAEIDDFRQCSGCLRRYCSDACQKADWEYGKHGGFCKPRTGKRAADRIEKMGELFGGVPYAHFYQMSEEQKNELHQILDDSTKEDIQEIWQMFEQDMNVDE